MALIENNVVKSKTSYDFKLPPDYAKKNLATIMFEEMPRRSRNKDPSKMEFVNARNPKDNCSYETMKLRSIDMAKTMKHLGLQRGETVQMMMQNNTEYFIPCLATWLCGGVVSLINPNSSAETLANQFTACKTAFIFGLKTNLKEIIEAVEKSQLMKKVYIVVYDGENQIEQEKFKAFTWTEFTEISKDLKETEVNEENIKPEEEVVIFWSSGTTGEPKGVLFHFDLLARMIVFEKYVFLEDHFELESFALTTNFYHAVGFTSSLINNIRSGNQVIIFPSTEKNCIVKPEELHEICHKFRPSVMILGSHHAIQLGYTKPKEGLDLSSLKNLLPMGSPVYKGLTENIRKYFSNLESLNLCYGTTETYLISYTKTPGELGLPLKGIEFKIRDLNTKENLGPDKIGEILVKTPYVMKGYLNKEQDKDFFETDGFGRTGDLGFYRNDGSLVFQARLKDLIKYNGNHLYPMEIENVIKKLPGIGEVAIFGMPSDEFQELVTAIVILEKGQNVTKEAIEKSVVDSGLESFKYIRGGVKFGQNLPKNATGKLMRRKLPEYFQSLP